MTKRSKLTVADPMSKGADSAPVENRAQAQLLKGVINSNDDPMACAICLASVADFDSLSLNLCCGADVCDACHTGIRLSGICQVCNCSYKRLSIKERAAYVKRNAKKNRPWAQFMLGEYYRKGAQGLQQSHAEAIRWFEKALKSGHPLAAYNLGFNYLEGLVCRKDLSKACRYLQISLSGSHYWASHSIITQQALCNVVEGYLDEGTDEGRAKAKSILLPLLDRDPVHPDIHFYLGDINNSEGMLRAACYHYCLYAIESQAEEAMQDVALRAVDCMMLLGDYAKGRFWAGKVKLSKMTFLSVQDRKTATITLITHQQCLRKLRDICGGCGAEFEGKDCKFCRGCRAYCYCSRECQKMHWNRKKNGHREDCLGLQDVKQKFKEAKSSKTDSSSTATKVSGN